MRMRKREREREKGLSAKSSASRPSNRLRQSRGNKKDRQGKGHFSDLSLLLALTMTNFAPRRFDLPLCKELMKKCPFAHCVETSKRKISNYYAATHLHVYKTWRIQLWHLF
jgi:hypothetical protein